MLHEQRAHHQVLVVELAGILPVRADAADDRREVDDDVGPMNVVEPLHVLFVDEVELAPPHDDDALRRGTPRRSKCRTTADPRNPAPPVTTIVLSREINRHLPFVIGYWLLVIALGIGY